MPMRVPPFNVTSHEELVREMADHHAHLGNGTQLANITNAGSSLQPSNVPSHEALVAYIADKHAHLGNSSKLVNVTVATNGTLMGAVDAQSTPATHDSRNTIGSIILGVLIIALIISIVSYIMIGRSRYIWKREKSSQTDIDLATQSATDHPGPY
ncbi:Endomucin [Cordyceps fumosorosea ARSEF 2679]|uniref:Endomucin n=1 Tax=Cordyceps fumosorosea (strain ARSEF 2679) TaxID=1081104 RepID=A0A168E550_CORFA|nr:Endomucin [Cordyceps fumosorosea ARSEF 2679]OAA73387.1 Endomucin [Cordyceps fumosorosea ARSEF 2679]